MTRAALLGASLLLPTHGSGLAQQEPLGILVESPTMETGVLMPRDYSPDGRNVSPSLVWRNLPAGTRQLVVLCEDHGAGSPPPWVHWLVYNIPVSAGGLPEGIPFDSREPMPAGLDGVRQGLNGWGLPMYRGPAPPLGTVHEYRFVGYALDTEMNLPPGLDRTEVLGSIAGHVIGRGEMTPIYERQPMGPPPWD